MNISELEELPMPVQRLLQNVAAPPLLTRHLTLVFNAALEITSQLQKEWPALPLKRDDILFGAATHDIGKVSVPSELFDKGRQHEAAGYALLIQQGIDFDLARFALNHGDWNEPSLTLEDLLVILADKIWKGRRIHGLEERISAEIAQALNLDFWEVNPKLDTMLSDLALGADQRLNWQDEG